MDRNHLDSSLPANEGQISHFWYAYRRVIFLASLTCALALFFVWLPGTIRSALYAAVMAQRSLITLLFLFGLIVLSFIWSAGNRIDAWVFLLINLRGHHPKWLDRLVWLATHIGNMWTAIILGGLFFVLYSRSLALEIILGTLMMWLLVEIIKVLTDRPRPFRALEDSRVVGRQERGHSFPSGHTTQTFFLAAILIHDFQLDFGAAIMLYAVGLLVGCTRIYVGAHYPRDVIGGAVLGIIGGVLAMLAYPYWIESRF